MDGVDILLVGYRSEEFLPRLREDIEILSCLPHTVHYWDNIGNPKSLSIAWNDLARQGQREYICVMNPDIALSPSWDGKLVRALQNPKIGTAHPTLHHAETTPAREALFDAASKSVEDIRVETWDVTQCGIDALKFFCPMIRRRDWVRLFGVDERMRMWKQDSDFHWRMRDRLGLVASFVVGCPVWHKGFASSSEAINRREINFPEEVLLSDDMWRRIRMGHLPDWDLLLPTGREDVRRNPMFQRIGQYGHVTNVHRRKSTRGTHSG